jgi:hypothetical protein
MLIWILENEKNKNNMNEEMTIVDDHYQIDNQILSITTIIYKIILIEISY